MSKVTSGLGNATLAYVNVFVSDFQRSLEFYRDTLGLEVANEDEQFGYASFRNKGAGFAFARVESGQAELVGRHTGIGWTVPDVDSSYEALSERGVEFTMPPGKQPWGGYMAMFLDPDGNVFYLDQPADH